LGLVKRATNPVGQQLDEQDKDIGPPEVEQVADVALCY
jgi:hypothetical protein